MGLDFPWLHGKAWQGEMYPLMAELRGMSISGEELIEGGHPLALIMLSITLTKHSTRSSLRLTPSCARPLEGERCVGEGRFMPRRRQPPRCAGLVGGPGGAGPPPPGAMLRRAHADAQWNWHTPSFLLHRALLMGLFSFKLFSLAFPLFGFFECPTLVTYDSTGI